MADIDHEQWNLRLNNEVVIPMYRSFCRSVGLTPLADGESRSGLEALVLHEEAMNVFNRLKPESVLVEDQVVSFRFTSWGGGFSSQAWPIQEFFEEASQTADRLGRAERLLRILAASLGTAVLVLALFVTAWLTPSSVFAYVAFPASLLGFVLVVWFEHRVMKNVADAPSETMEAIERLRALRRKVWSHPISDEHVSRLPERELERLTKGIEERLLKDPDGFVRDLRRRLHGRHMQRQRKRDANTHTDSSEGNSATLGA